MQNDQKKIVDKYIPRKCTATNRVITAGDHAAVQINIGIVDENGVYSGQTKPLALCGFVRGKGLADDAINRITKESQILKDLE